jgi:hypothetical protein
MKSARKARVRLYPAGHQINFETLEPRLLLASDIRVVSNDHGLTLISRADVAHVEVIGADDGGVTITPLDAETTINGSSEPLSIAGGFQDLTINLWADDVRLELSGVSVPDNLQIRAGRAHDIILLDSVHVEGKADIQTWKGGVTLDIVDSVFDKSLFVGSTDGDDSVRLVSTTVARHLQVSTGTGADEIRLSASTVGKNTDLITGQDDDHICLVDSVFARLDARLDGGEDRLDATGSSAVMATIDGGQDHDIFGRDETNQIERLKLNRVEELTDELCDELQLPDFELFINPSDPLLFSAQGSNGTLIEYFGTKTDTGLAISLETIIVTNAQGDATIIKVDANGRPTTIFAATGETFLLEWLTETRVLATVISSDGSLQVNTVIDFAAPAGITSTAHLPSQPSSTARGGAHIAHGTHVGAVITPLHGLAPAGVAATSQSIVTVTHCEDMPVEDAVARILVQPDSGDSFIVPAPHIGNGQYAAAIPTKDVSAGETAESICESVLSVLSGCFLIEPIPPQAITQICIGLGAAVDFALGGPTGEGAAIFAACEVGLLAYQAACKINPAPDAPGAPGLLDVICENIQAIVDRAVGDEYLLTPIVNIPGQGAFTAPAQSALVSGPFPDFSVEAGGQVEIASFVTVPADPAPFEPYVATVTITCAMPNTTVNISIVGTDGYTDSIVCTISGDDVCTLTVPGAEAGVFDVVTVSVLDGPTRTIGLVF